MNQNLISLDDKELVILFKGGNADAFGVLIQKHTQSLSYSLFRILKDTMLVDDVLQDTFLRAMEAIQKDTYTDIGNFRAWLAQIGHNLAIDYFRKVKRRNTFNVSTLDGSNEGESYFTLLVDSEISPEDKFISLETDYDIQALIDQLPEEQREVIKLRHFHGFSFKEIADYIGGGVSINTCLGRMRYGLINLRKAINEIRFQGKKIM